MGSMLTVPSDTIEQDPEDLLTRLRKVGILRSALAGGGDLPYQRVATNVQPGAAGTGLSDEAAPPENNSLLDEAGINDESETEDDLAKAGAAGSTEDEGEAAPTLLRPGEKAGSGLPRNEPQANSLQELADIAGGRARQAQEQEYALEHPSLKNRIIRAIIEAAPIAIGAAAAPGNAGAGVGGQASLQFQMEQEREKELEQNRLQQEMQQGEQQEGSLATQAALEQERQQRDAAYERGQDALSALREQTKPRQDPNEGKVVTVGQNQFQWNPQTKRYDIPVGAQKASIANRGKGWGLEYGKDGTPIALRDPQGDLHQPDDEDIPAPVQTLWQNAVENSQQSGVKPEIAAQVGPKPTSNAYNGKKYASIKEAQAAWGADVQKHVDDEAEASAGARGASYGRNRPTSVIDTFNGNRPVTVSAGEAEDNPERYVTQSGGEKALGKEALIQDIRTTIGNVGDSLTKMKAGFNAPQRMMLAASLGDPNGTAAQFFQSLPRGSALDETQQNYVIDIFQLRENAMAMRSLLGTGQGSDELRRAIIQTLPGPGTPSKGYAQQQLKRLNQTVDRLERGVPTVPLAGAGPQRAGAGRGAAPNSDPLGIR